MEELERMAQEALQRIFEDPYAEALQRKVKYLIDANVRLGTQVNQLTLQRGNLKHKYHNAIDERAELQDQLHQKDEELRTLKATLEERDKQVRALRIAYFEDRDSLNQRDRTIEQLTHEKDVLVKALDTAQKLNTEGE